MFRNYLKVVFRNIRNQKAFSLINILGLALGLAVCMFAIIYIRYELSYDRYHQNADNIYRITSEFHTTNGYNPPFARCHQEWINHLPDDFPEIESLTRFQWTPSVNLKIEEKKIQSFQWFYTDPNIFDVFSFKIY